MVQRRAMVLSFTSLISTSGGSGGSERQPCTVYHLKVGSKWKTLGSSGFKTLNGELNYSSIFTKRVDCMAREEARILSYCWHDLMNKQEKGLDSQVKANL